MGDTSNASAKTNTADVLAVLDRFGEAWNDHDLDAALALVSDDCVFESTGPAPEGGRFQGKAQLREAWGSIFANPASRFTVEDTFAAGDRVAQQWRYSWGNGSVRGVDLFRVADGLVREKLSYVKG